MLKKIGSFAITLAAAALLISGALALCYGHYKEWQEREASFKSALHNYEKGNLEGAISNLETNYANYDYWLSKPQYEREVRKILISYSIKLRNDANTQGEEVAKKTRELARYYEVTAKGKYD